MPGKRAKWPCFSCPSLTKSDKNRQGKRFCEKCILINRIFADEFMNGYLAAILFSDSEEIGELTVYEIEKGSLLKIISDCEKFQNVAKLALKNAGDESQNGMDFWFTRQGHGVGFWDRGYTEETTKALDLYCGQFGELYVLADGATIEIS